MAGFMEKASVGAERMRCYELVRAYREKIERSMAKRPVVDARDQKIADAVIQSLLGIEGKIKNPRKNISDVEFSLDEMAIAEKLIAEQEENPFEV